MSLRWLLVLLLVAAATGKGKKHKHQKPGRALFDRLASTPMLATAPPPEPFSVFPAPVDAAPFSSVTANATCGENGAEDYCRMTPGRRGVVCSVCDGEDGAAARRHPALHVVDADPDTWWQSPTLANGEQYRHVELVFTLPDVLELLHVIIKSGPSPRPLAWSLEVSPSEDGDDFRLLRAFGDKDHCKRLWDLRPERKRRKARAVGKKRTDRSDKPTCSTQFASPKPLENGEMHVGIGEGVSCRRVRVSFRAVHAAPALQQYYSVRGVTLAARCLCSGHATSCHLQHAGAECMCLHGTCGRHCESVPPCDVSPAACAYDNSGLLCVNCTDNRAGPLCDSCLPGYYSAGVGAPCEPCPCHTQGTDGPCTFDRSTNTVKCPCLPNITGRLCDKCASGGLFPHCSVEGRCDERGVRGEARGEKGECVCKENVIGPLCDSCAPGFWGLSASDPAGCRPCYCRGDYVTCTEDPLPGEPLVLPMSGEWLVLDAAGNQSISPSRDEQGLPYIISYEVEGWEGFWWVPAWLSGSQLEQYASRAEARAGWGAVRGDAGGSPTTQPDFVLVGKDGTKLVHGAQYHETPGDVTLTADLVETSWRLLADDGEHPVSRELMMDVLGNVDKLMIRAHFHTDQDEVHLYSLEFLPAPPSSREVCVCDATSAGRYCQLPVVNCPCNGHADCDTDGVCGPCQHNTTGPHCERCLPGYYGNPVVGGCKRCACPLVEDSNNFSPNCAANDALGLEYVCTQCPEGYAGDHCQFCEPGYFGSPGTPGGQCSSCGCGAAACDPSTGACVTCQEGVVGAACDQCREGYYPSEGVPASNMSCLACGCGAGALVSACDQRGRCACKPGYTGRACDICDLGYGDIAAGCPHCACGVASLTPHCDPLWGRCECHDGAAGPHCDQCEDGYYGLTELGCSGCNCSALGAEGKACDIRTGQCRCKPHVTGRACDVCEEGYWGLSAHGCRPCECGAGGSCDPDTGVCACAAGLTGAHCDACLPGYYGYGPAGCLPCLPCPRGRVCSPVTGRCGCPAHTRGEECAVCAPGRWGRAPHCRLCACGPGAMHGSCDPATGQCPCRPGWGGRDCSTCAEGHFGPQCRACRCNPAGSQCTGDVCSCDSLGRCPCKENVIGDKCSHCRPGSFDLSSDNPSGCTACFCFGRSVQCEGGKLTMGTLADKRARQVTLLYRDIVGELELESLITLPHDTLSASLSPPRPSVPIYWTLPPRFSGDLVTSYGGYLKFAVEQQGGREIEDEVKAKFPLVRIYGSNVELDYFERAAPINNTYWVRLQESLFRVGPALVSRGALMAALQNVSAILVRASTRAPGPTDPVVATVSNITLDTAAPGAPHGPKSVGVELCSCPRGYSAASCHRPAPGYYMPNTQVHFHTVSGTIVIQTEDAAEPCFCNGRSEDCNPRTGHCLNCTGNTAGPQCEQCAPGYIGSPETGCAACRCPQRYQPLCDTSGPVPVCRCAEGYTGPDCSSCLPGYTLSPLGLCVRCRCSEPGSLFPACDSTGHCTCRPGVAGRNCDVCTDARSVMSERGCQACDNCTATLLDSIEQLTNDLIQTDMTDLSKIPKPYLALSEYSTNATKLREKLDNLTSHTINHDNYELIVKNLENSAKKLVQAVENNDLESKMQDQASYSLSLESMTGLEEVLAQRGRIGELVASLDEFAVGERHLTSHRAMKEARKLLQDIKRVGVIEYLAGANDAFDKASLQSASIQELVYRIDDLLSAVVGTRGRLRAWEGRRDDAGARGDTVWDQGDQVDMLMKGVGDRVANVRDLGRRIEVMHEELKKLPPDNTTAAILDHLSTIEALAAQVPTIQAELNTLILAAEEKEGILYNLTPSYKEKYLDAVGKHVAKLGRRAEEYKKLFSGARQASSLGMAAANAWAYVSSNISEAQRLSDHALETAILAGKLAQGSTPLLEAAEEAKRKSLEIRDKGIAVMQKAQELGSEVGAVQQAVELAGVVLRGAGWAARGGAAAAAAAAARPASLTHTLTEPTQHAHRVFETMRALYDEASGIVRSARYDLRRQLSELQRHGDSALGAAQEHVSQSRGNTIRARELISSLSAAAAARAHEHAAADARLPHPLAHLHHIAARARDAAASISVSLTSSPMHPGCSRAYRVSPTPSPVTRISLSLSFDKLVKDGPILYLECENGFLNLTVEDGKAKIAWDLGDGVASVINEEVLEATHDDSDHTLYRMEIERVWTTVRLTVERSGRTATISSHTSHGTHVSLTPRRLWLGHPSAHAGLPACIHMLSFADRRIGLWNFLEQPKEAKCQGCTQRWRNPSVGDGMAWFDGSGYSELRRSGLRPTDRRRFSVSFVFRTRDHDATLFMAKEPNSNRSVSIFLRKCRVVLAVVYSSSRLELEGRGRHCHGRLVRVQAARMLAPANTDRGSLRVNGEETLGSPEPLVQDEASLPELSSASYWVGGSPPGEPGGVPLLGCVGTLVVDREGIDLLDTSKRSGVEAGCGGKPIHSVTLSPTGYVEIPSRSLGRKSALGISFSTRATSRTLMELRPDEEHHLMLKIDKGEVELSIKAGKNEVKLRTNGTKYNDGVMHTVRVIRAHKEVELWLNEHKAASSPLAGHAVPAGELLLGGRGEPPAEGDSGDRTLVLADFIIDGTVIGFESSSTITDGVLSRAPPPAAHHKPDTLRKPHKPLCAKASSYTVEPDAVKFGDRSDSHATFRLEPRPKQLVASLHFRTFRPTGTLLLNTGSKSKPKHFILLSLKDGKLKLTVRARKKKEVMLPTTFNDGTWKSVSIRVTNKKILLSSGGAAATGRAPRRLALAQRVYVGGAPKQVSAAPGLIGCVRRVSLSGTLRDVARAAPRASQCFPTVTQGGYFAGDAHAVWSMSWAAAAELRLRFRTREPQAVLLAANSFLLHLHHGQVTLTTFSSRGVASSVTAAGSASCDGSWHVAAAVLWPLPSVSTDDGPVATAAAPRNADMMDAQHSPLYVGGLPENYEGVGSGKENFKGCLQDVAIGGETKDWTQMESLQNVLIDSCPET